MRTDEPEPGDAPGSPRHPPPSRDQPAPQAPAAPPSRAEQLTAHDNYRAAVTAAERAARTTDQAGWPQALPGLRAAWNEHKQRHPQHPRPEPRTEPDGSWNSGHHRKLSPGQNTEAAKARADLTDEAGQRILPALRRIEAADPQRKLSGLEHMIKGEDRLKEKLADFLRAPEVTVADALNEVPDAIRYTFRYSVDQYSSGVLADVAQLKEAGFELIKLKNLWEAEQYKGINSQWRVPESQSRFEVQFHTAESLEAKELTHEAYERIRGELVTSAEERELGDYQRHVNIFVRIPPGTSQIKDFPEQHDA